jgi:glutamate-5-semialdehyde dehydrogenase
MSSAPVLVSGRGNNFVYLDADADLVKAKSIILNGKLNKISVCNATDKVLFDKNIPGWEAFLKELILALNDAGCQVIGDASLISFLSPAQIDPGEEILYEEFLAPKIFLSIVDGRHTAIQKINTFSGGHTAVIVTEDQASAEDFMDSIDAASVIHNASSRYTDGGQFGLGAELAISTDKLHHRGPLGLEHLVTNKWYVYGDGQIRG